jgi:hypothetical protein
VHIITFVSIELGSTVVSGYCSPAVMDNSAAASALSASFSSGYLGNYPAASSSSATEEGSNSADTSKSSHLPIQNNIKAIKIIIYRHFICNNLSFHQFLIMF